VLYNIQKKFAFLLVGVNLHLDNRLTLNVKRRTEKRKFYYICAKPIRWGRYTRRHHRGERCKHYKKMSLFFKFCLPRTKVKILGGSEKMIILYEILSTYI